MVKLKELHIHLLPVGAVESSSLEEIARHLMDVFPGCRCTKVQEGIALSREAYNSSRGQYNSTSILAELSKTVEGRVNADRVLVIVDVDLYADGLNYVFGEAQCPGRLAIISTFRLRPEFYREDNGSVFTARVNKEATHELGHTLGLSHCPDPRCVMHFSNNIEMTDMKDATFCRSCRSALQS